MARYTTPMVMEFLKLPEASIRYWEKHLTLVEPQSDMFGHRSYSVQEIATLHRIKHLIDHWHIQLHKAEQRLQEENINIVAGGWGELRLEIMQLRSTLIRLYFEYHKGQL